MSRPSGLDTDVKPPETNKPNTKRVNFSVDTRKASVETKDTDGVEQTYLNVPISSLQEDRDGDELSDSGMESLLAQVSQTPVGLFPNHGMDPESSQYDYRNIFGAWEDGQMEDGTTMGKVRLRRESADSSELYDDAAELKDLIEQDMPVGFSIGFGWDEKDVEELDNGGLKFNDLDLMEVSAVGIPSNPEAVVQASSEIATAMKSAGVDPTQLDTDELTESLKTAMTDETEDSETDEVEESDDEEEEEQEQANKELDDEDIDLALSVFESVVSDHMNAMMSEVEAELSNAEDSEDSDDEEDTEETEGDDGDGEEDEDDEDKSALKSELEELRTELETIKSERAESEGRKGGMTPAEKDTDTDGEPDETNSVAEEFAEGLV